MKIKNKGFTLIELMVTVAIIGIIGAVAVPAYQDYTIRSQVTEALSVLSGVKVQVTERFATDGTLFKGSTQEWKNLSFLTQYKDMNYIQAVRFEPNQNRISAIFGEKSHRKIMNGTISLTPEETDNGNLKWNCESDLPQEYLPSSCKHMNLAMRAENDPTTINVTHHDDGTSSWTALAHLTDAGEPWPTWCNQQGVYLENYQIIEGEFIKGRQAAAVTCRTTKIGR